MCDALCVENCMLARIPGMFVDGGPTEVFRWTDDSGINYTQTGAYFFLRENTSWILIWRISIIMDVFAACGAEVAKFGGRRQGQCVSR